MNDSESQSRARVVDAEPKRWSFGDAVLDQQGRELRLNGRVVKVDKKPLAVLLHLLQHADEMVTKEDLQTAVWPGRVLSDSVLTKTLSRLRAALRDDDETLIKTVRGYGYRLMTPVLVELSTNAQTTPAERRPLSILFCGWVDAAALSERVDAEIFRETLLAYHACADAIIKRYEGHLAQVSSDGMEIHFGHPTAHDDDAERAARCGLDLLQALPRLVRQPRLAVRAGVHTGMVVIGGEIAGIPGSAALGLTCNLAGRLAAMAEPGDLLISAATRERVPGLFIVKRQASIHLQIGRSRLPVYKLVQATGMRSRLEAATALTPFVGRQRELSLLTDLWQQSTTGHGQALLISGDPGLGKSRLLLHLRKSLCDGPHSWLECRAHALTRGTDYQPLIDLLQQLLKFSQTDPPDVRLHRLEQALDAAGEDRQQAIPLLAALFDLPPNPRYPPSQSTPLLKQRQTNALLSRWLLRLGQRQPLLLAIEDLHWADPSTLEVLTQVLEQLADRRILMVMTARPEFSCPWRMLHLSSISLVSLGRQQVDDMLGHLILDKAQASTIGSLVHERANGVPLFVEELVKSLVESGLIDKRGDILKSLDEADLRSIPTRLQDLLSARLDRLGTARECAQIASAIEGEIPHRLLALVADREDGELLTQIKCLTDGQLLYQRGHPPDAIYQFKHALIRDAAYDSLLKKDRQRLHEKIANRLEAHFPQRVRTEPAVAAQHFEQAGIIEKATQYYEAAAELALSRSSLAEAIQHCRHALSLLTGQADDEATATSELRILLLQHLCQLMLSALGDPEVGTILLRAAGLLERVRSPLLHGRTRAALWQYRFVRGELSEALDNATHICDPDAADTIPVLQALGGITAGWTRWMLGEPAAAWRDLSRAHASLNQERSRQIIGIIGSDGITDCLTLMSSLSWWLGFPERARALIPRAKAAAESSGDFISKSLAAVFSETLVPILQRNPAGLVDICIRFEAMTRQHSHQGMNSIARMHRGLALSLDGLHDEGLPMLRQALDEQPDSGSLVIISMYSCLLAQQCLQAGRIDEAGAALAKAASTLNRYQARLWEAELYRLQGELIVARNTSDASSAEACFREALDVSCRQQARSLELRAATSLARLWQRQRRAAEARALLTPIYDGFTEGFDLPDLMEAGCLIR